MMASHRLYDGSGNLVPRRGHNANQLSISDSSHHITETIGTLYGDDDDYLSTNTNNENSRPLSFVAAPRGGEQINDYRQHQPATSSSLAQESQRPRPLRTTSDHLLPSDAEATSPRLNGNSRNTSTLSRMPSQRSISNEAGGQSPTLRDMRDEPDTFPMTNINGPNDIAQELSNLQALRRMSMDVSNHQDPDLLPYQNMALTAIPSVAPQGDDDEADPSRLLWVPANVHPELAPDDFKSFLEKRVQTIKRRSGGSLSPDGLDRSDSGSLRRKRSMLSRQVNNVGPGAEGYVDGAERLERKQSISQGRASQDLSIDDLVKDPTGAVQRLTLESQRPEGGLEGHDMPILPVAPGMGLRRSTNTTYRKGGSLKDRGGSLKNRDRVPFAQRVAARKAEEAGESGPESPPEMPSGHALARVQSEPVSENFSRPSGSMRRKQGFMRDHGGSITEEPLNEAASQDATPRPGSRRAASTERSRTMNPIPQIIETPAIEEENAGYFDRDQMSGQYPERSASQGQISPTYQSIPSPTSPPAGSPPEEPAARSNRRPNYAQPPPQSLPQSQAQSSHVPPPKRSPTGTSHGINDMASQPLGSGNANRTDSLTFIPTFSADDTKKSEKKSKKDRDSESGSSKSSSWKWFKKEEREKKKMDKEREKEREEESRRSKNKSDKSSENVRLDVLQTSIDGSRGKGRESLMLDRDSADNRLEEERRKESNRKSSESRKEKDGLFASFFGGSKKKGDRDSGSRKSQSHRPASPEPAPYRPQRPDVDYNWTRFPILEERAIYRMAHIKLANPRRALYSQVLLSNFMYAYLAKVQAMHPQIQVPQSPQQKRLQEEERRRQEQEQQYLEQQQAQESIDHYNFEYHRSMEQYAESDMQHDDGDYPEDAEIYDYDHGKSHHGEHDNRAYHQEAGDYDRSGGQGASDKDYYAAYEQQQQYYGNGNGHGRRGHQQQQGGDMW